MTYFDLLGMHQPTFDVDPQALEKKYKRLQWQLHPDKAGSKTAVEQDYSAAQASQINQAYQILRHPLSRANYLLKLHGVVAGDEFEGTIENPELLMEVMEAREEVESTNDPDKLHQLLTSNRTQQQALVVRLREAFKQADLQQAAELTTQLTYLDRLQQAILLKS
eukprot:jgi/Chrzof1/1918/Cz10g26080.t1